MIADGFFLSGKMMPICERSRSFDDIIYKTETTITSASIVCLNGIMNDFAV